MAQNKTNKPAAKPAANKPAAPKVPAHYVKPSDAPKMALNGANCGGSNKPIDLSALGIDTAKLAKLSNAELPRVKCALCGTVRKPYVTHGSKRFEHARFEFHKPSASSAGIDAPVAPFVGGLTSDAVKQAREKALMAQHKAFQKAEAQKRADKARETRARNKAAKANETAVATMPAVDTSGRKVPPVMLASLLATFGGDTDACAAWFAHRRDAKQNAVLAEITARIAPAVDTVNA